ncbi:MAG: YibE/F family protein [Candidatus Gracilibacteria bacterium]|jgi:uncharacterized membrane protein|nr:YibE/F family protein [Candidatus Gracilibacteria bacterium]
MKKILLIIFSFVCLIQPTLAEGVHYFKAEVLEVQDVKDEYMDDRILRVRLLEGEIDKELDLSLGGQAFNPLRIAEFYRGETVVVSMLEKSDGTYEYFFNEKYRLPQVFMLFGFFVFLSVFFARGRGVGSLLGLVVSLGILFLLIIPLIVKGYSPFYTGLFGCFLIAICSIPLSHGFNKISAIVLSSILLTLFVSAFFSLFVVYFTQLFGFGSESAFSAQLSSLASLDFRGVLLVGILLGALGVLDDVCATQARAIYEIKKAGPNLGFKSLFNHGMNVGKEHIFALINTLALAYSGAFLPLLLLLYNENLPLWVVLNSEMLSEEIVRTILGSISLVLAVPVTNLLASWYFAKNESK